MLHWHRVSYRTSAWYYVLIPLAFWSLAIGAANLISMHQEGYGADPNMSPRQAQDSSQQIGLE